jgi:ferredoxin
MTETNVQVAVDPARCQGHNRCYNLAPELFDVDEYGIASAVGDGAVPDHLVDKARRAVANCPEYAITMTPPTPPAPPTPREDRP